MTTSFLSFIVVLMPSTTSECLLYSHSHFLMYNVTPQAVFVIIYMSRWTNKDDPDDV